MQTCTRASHSHIVEPFFLIVFQYHQRGTNHCYGYAIYIRHQLCNHNFLLCNMNHTAYTTNYQVYIYIIVISTCEYFWGGEELKLRSFLNKTKKNSKYIKMRNINIWCLCKTIREKRKEIWLLQFVKLNSKLRESKILLAE